MRPLRLRAAWALPIDAPPIRDAALLLDAEGRIAAIGPDAAVPSPAGLLQESLGNAILLPGLVNTHTHLELTGFEDRAPEADFREWILTIRRIKEARNREEYLAAARQGVRDCWAAGVTTVADTGDSGSAMEALAELGGGGIAYQEVFGPHPDQLAESFAGLTRRIGELSRLAGGRLRIGVSPHAPYTVSGPLYSKVAAWAGSEGLPIAVHLAESREESEFVTHGRGPFAEGWRRRGIPLLDDSTQQPSAPNPPGPVSHPHSPVEWLDSHGVLGPATLCIHTVQLSASDIDLLARRGASVAHCPLSNARHRHGAAPLAALRRAGIRVGLGTDSVASVGALDLLAEARAAMTLSGLTADQAIALATLESARALGLDRETGSLTPGKWGDVIAVAGEAAPGAQPGGPAAAAVAASPRSVLLTVLGGRVVHRAGR